MAPSEPPAPGARPADAGAAGGGGPEPATPLLAALVAAVHRRLAGHRALLVAAMVLLVGAAGLISARATLREDLGALLPDDRSDAGRDFALFSATPIARRVLVSVTAAPGVPEEVLAAAADGVEATLGPPLFAPPPAAAGPAEVAALLSRALPTMAGREDFARLTALTPAAVRERLAGVYALLLSPEGVGVKGFLRADPLGIAGPILERTSPLGMTPGTRSSERRLRGPDGRSLLLLLDSPVPMTDFGRARAMEERLRAAAAALPAGVTLRSVSGHRYTLANSQTIRTDLATILGLSSLAILAIYVFFLRSRQALFVFLVPAVVLLFATAGVSLMPGGVFAITLGFGGVLLGMADEYAMHVFFAVRHAAGDQARAVGAAARPVVMGGLATSAAFGIMAFSSLPGQRQLGVFCLIGIGASLVVSLVVLPHLVNPGAATLPPLPRPASLPGRVVLPVWLALLALGCAGATQLRFDGSMTSLNHVTPELRAAEDEIRTRWGDLRGKAVIFARGATLEEALERNEAVYRGLLGTFKPAEVVSLAPVLPAAGTREARRREWLGYWAGPDGRRTLEALRAQAAGLGFSPAAFAPFLETTVRPAAAPDPEALRAAGFGGLVDALVLRGAAGVSVLTLTPDDGRAAAALAGAPAGVVVVSPRGFGVAISEALHREFRRYLLLASLVILVVVGLTFRGARERLLALVPVVTGLVFMFGVMGAVGMPVNLFNIIATVLIIGMCVDYGIFMVSRGGAGEDPATSRAVLVSGLTTIAGFGVLALATHPALRSLGLTVLLGFGAAVPAALLVIPALLPRGPR
jgi:predicted exporter